MNSAQCGTDISDDQLKNHVCSDASKTIVYAGGSFAEYVAQNGQVVNFVWQNYKCCGKTEVCLERSTGAVTLVCTRSRANATHAVSSRSGPLPVTAKISSLPINVASLKLKY